VNHVGDEGVFDCMAAAAASTSSGIFFLGANEHIRYSELVDSAMKKAAALASWGIGPGAHVGVLCASDPEGVSAILSVWAAGATLVILPVPNRVASPDALVEGLRNRARDSDLHLLLIDEAFEILRSALEDAISIRSLSQLNVAARSAAAWQPSRVSPSDTAVLQFTSGSTSEPRGVIISQRNMLANFSAMAAGTDLDVDRDRLLSWLPLFHDMGLFGFLAYPVTYAIDLVLAEPTAFLARPGNWMQWLSDFRATATAGPNFGYSMARRQMPSADTCDLSAADWLMWGAEPVDAALTRQFAGEAAGLGLRDSALCAGYGLAEATLSVCLGPRNSGIDTEWVSRASIGAGSKVAQGVRGQADALELVVMPPVLPGLNLWVEAPDGSRLPERVVGEIVVSGASVSAGYYKQEQTPDTRLLPGQIATGDLGYISRGRLVPCGRSKDVVIVGGRNFYPDEIERIAARVTGVRPGNVAAVGILNENGTEALVVVAESRTDDRAATIRELRERILGAVGLSPHRIYLVEEGALPKTSSGKIRRFEVRSDERWH